MGVCWVCVSGCGECVRGVVRVWVRGCEWTCECTSGRGDVGKCECVWVRMWMRALCVCVRAWVSRGAECGTQPKFSVATESVKVGQFLIEIDEKGYYFATITNIHFRPCDSQSPNPSHIFFDVGLLVFLLAPSRR